MYVAGPMLALLLWNFSALAADPRDELTDAYRDVPQVADHIVLLDLGGATPEQVEADRGAALALAAALPAGDRLAVISFTGQAVTELAPTPIVDAERAALAERIQAMPLVPGAHSDLGLALDATRALIRAQGRSDLAIVSLFSDFCHDPPEDSPYAFPGTEGCRQVRGLTELSASFEALGTEVLILPIAVTVGRSDPDGKAAFFRALGKGESLALEASAPAELSTRYVEGLPWRKLKALVRQELEGYSLSAEVVPSEGDQVRLNVKSGLSRLGVELTTVSFSDPGLVPATRNLSLQPNGEIDLIVQDAEPPLSPIPRTRTRVFDGYVSAIATLEPRSALSRMGIPAGKGQVRIPLHVEWTQRYGPPGWALGLVALAVLGLVSWWRRAQRSA